MTTPTDIPAAQPANENSKPEVSLYHTKTELERLESDLKYVTGAANKAELEAEIKKLKESLGNSSESELIAKSLDDNFEIGMSFNEGQKKAMSNLNTFIKDGSGKSDLETAKISDPIKGEYKGEEDTDLNIKKNFDDFVKAYRFNRSSKNLNDNRYLELDNLVLAYEKSFNINAGPIVSEVDKDTKRIEQKRQNDISFVKGKMDYLKTLEKRLLEEKSSAKVSILGRKDTSKTEPIEKEILKLKSAIALGVTMAASTYLGFNIENSDIGL